MRYSKSSKRESDEVLKIQQESDELLKIQQLKVVVKAFNERERENGR